MMIEKWEVWNVQFAYEDKPEEAKIRPVLVIDARKNIVIALKITSHNPRKEYGGEDQIEKWKEAGLDKPSVVRCSKRAVFEESDFISKRGKLQSGDIISIQALLNYYYQ